MTHGGHAIMLTIKLNDRIRDAVNEWAAKKPLNRFAMLDEPHVTLVFVGRNLDDSFGERMSSVVERDAEHAPSHIALTGTLDAFGLNNDHLVALVEPVHALKRYVGMLDTSLASMGVDRSRNFGFHPHVTLATTREPLTPLDLSDSALDPINGRIDMFAERLKVSALVAKVGSNKIRILTK